jgi:para-aminobenzoate synthetase/4-amino-4-deoxychorismate lyase
MRQRLDALIRTLPPRQHKIRLLLASDGSIHIEAALLQPASTPQRIALASFPVEPDDLFLRHKTTRREIYETAMRAHPQEDDVLLWNRRGELTESARANLVLSLGGQMWTPAASSGLLPGVLRAELLAQGKIREAILTKDDLHSADAVYLINSVRGWMPATVVE